MSAFLGPEVLAPDLFPAFETLREDCRLFQTMDWTQSYNRSRFECWSHKIGFALPFCSFLNHTVWIFGTNLRLFKVQLSPITSSHPLPSQLTFFARRSTYGKMSVQGIEAVKRISSTGPGSPAPLFLHCFIFPFCMSNISFSSHS